MKLLINGLIVAAAIGCGFYVTRGSWSMYSKLNAEAQAHTRDMNVAEKLRLQKLDEANRAQTSIGHEEEARRTGYLAPNEVAR